MFLAQNLIAMKRIKKDELYENLGHFLKSKGIEMKEGSYATAVQKSCSFLADTINLSQKGLERAKAGIDKKLDQVRQVIHEKTAPKSAASASPARNSAAKAKKVALKARPGKSSARRPRPRGRSGK